MTSFSTSYCQPQCWLPRCLCICKAGFFSPTQHVHKIKHKNWNKTKTSGQVTYSSSSWFQPSMPPFDNSTVVCLQQCRSVSFVLFLLFFHTLLHRLVIDPLQHSPSIFCLVVLLIFSRLVSTNERFWPVCRPSPITYAQAILTASVWSILLDTGTKT